MTSLRPLASLAALALSLPLLGACFVDREYSDETIIEFEACATFGDRCGDLSDFAVISPDLGQQAEGPVGDRLRFRNVQPSRVITFEVQGYSGNELLYTATCDIGATPYTTVEADCRNDVQVAN